MKKRNKPTTQEVTSWAELRPRRLHSYSVQGTTQEGDLLVAVEVSRFHGLVLQSWWDRLELRPHEVRLDAIGSLVWLQCTGQTPVKAIGEALRARFGAHVEPVEERLTQFLTVMSRKALVALQS